MISDSFGERAYFSEDLELPAYFLLPRKRLWRLLSSLDFYLSVLGLAGAAVSYFLSLTSFSALRCFLQIAVILTSSEEEQRCCFCCDRFADVLFLKVFC